MVSKKQNEKFERNLDAFHEWLRVLTEKKMFEALEGKVALFYDGELTSVFDTREAAASEGLKKYGTDYFSLLEVDREYLTSRYGRIATFTRHV